MIWSVQTWAAAASYQVDSLLLSQLTLELEWRRSERFLQCEVSQMIPWGSLRGYSERLASWADRQGMRQLCHGSTLLEPSPLPMEPYRKIARLQDALDVAVSAQGLSMHFAPDAMLRAMDAHAQGVGQWLKVAGMEKADVIEGALGQGWAAAWVAVEFGAFVGYTSVRLASRLASESGCLRSVSLEVDHIHQVVARHALHITRLSAHGEVWNGQVRDLLPRLLDETGSGSCGLAFLDHRGTRFHCDSALLAKLGSPGGASHVVADNVLNPGSPVFAWNVRRCSHASIWILMEFMSNEREDWMVVADVGRQGSRGKPAEASSSKK